MQLNRPIKVGGQMGTAETWITFEAFELDLARRLAEERLTQESRRLSRDRPTARNDRAQFRGALGEIGAAKWLRNEGFLMDEGYLIDSVQRTDLRVNGRGIEVMTAQIAHRVITGFCVPPNKLFAARRRNAWGYLFVGTGPELACTTVCIQGGCLLDRVDADPPRYTRVSSSSLAVQNHVIRAEHLLSPEQVLRCMGEGGKP